MSQRVEVHKGAACITVTASLLEPFSVDELTTPVQWFIDMFFEHRDRIEIGVVRMAGVE